MQSAVCRRTTRRAGRPRPLRRRRDGATPIERWHERWSAMERWTGGIDRKNASPHGRRAAAVYLAPGRRMLASIRSCASSCSALCPRNERFGLGPFFRIEPLGMEYIAAALEAARPSTSRSPTCASPGRSRSEIRAGPAGSRRHRRDARARDRRGARARRASARALRRRPIVVGGHTAAAYPAPFFTGDVDAVVLDDGERALPAHRRGALAARRAADGGPRPRTRADDGEVTSCAPPARPATFALDDVPLPARHHVERWRRQYACLAHRPTWLIETARGCPFRCSFCSIWQLHARSVRERSIDAVCRDFASVGDHVFIADDLFWHHPARSLELAQRAAPPRHPQAVDSRPEPRRSRGAASRAARGMAADRARLRHFLRARGGDQRGAERADQGRDGRRRRREASTSPGELGLRRHRQLRDRSGTGARTTSSGSGRSSNARALPGRVHDPDAAARVPRTSSRCGRRLRARQWSQFDMHHLLWEPALGPGGSSSCTARRGADRC